MSSIKKNGTVYFLDAYKLVFIKPTKLTFEKAFNLLYDLCNYDSDNLCWIFTIKVSESNVTDDGATLVDIKEDNTKKTAICILQEYEGKTLYCRSKTSNQLKTLYLYKNSTNKHVEWNNLDKDEYIYLNLYITLLNSFGTFINNQWKFSVNMYTSNYNIKDYYYYNYALMDISYNYKNETAICKFGSNILNCVCYFGNQSLNDLIEITGNYKPILGTIYFNKALSSNERKFKNPELDIKFYSYQNKNCFSSENKPLSIIILGYSSNSFYYKTFTEIMIEKIYGEGKSRAACEVKELESSYYYYGYNIELNCTTDTNFILRTEGARISINNTGYSGFVKFRFNNEIKEKIICEGQETSEPTEPTESSEPSDTTKAKNSNNIIYNNMKKLFFLISLLLV